MTETKRKATPKAKAPRAAKPTAHPLPGAPAPAPPSPAVVSEFHQIVEELHQAEAENQLDLLYSDTADNGHRGGPYPWQVRFHDAGSRYPERAILAANQTGKSRTCAAEVAMHLSGLYPRWWRGHRFTKAISMCASAPTNELVRDIVQRHLFGEMREGMKAPSGRGWVPASRIIDFGFRQCGIANVLDYVTVKHTSGRPSKVSFKSYEQGNVKFQGVEWDLAWLDEEPEDEAIFPEVQTRLIARKGILIFSRTPLFGTTAIVDHFLSNKPGTWCVNVTWDDAPHLGEAERERLASSYPDHERKTRVSGMPMMGVGAVYNVSDSSIECEPFRIPPHFRRICGCDFGIDHPAAAVWIAHDADADVVYVYDCYKQKGETAAYHGAAIAKRGAWIPVAWPHDGAIRDKGGGEPLKSQYRDAGANMLSISARYSENEDRAGGQPREPVTMEILERMRTGRFKVFHHLREWFEEKRRLHRNKSGVIVPEFDDLESATRYGMMMLRYAVSQRDQESFRQMAPEASQYDPLGAFRESA